MDGSLDVTHTELWTDLWMLHALNYGPIFRCYTHWIMDGSL